MSLGEQFSSKVINQWILQRIGVIIEKQTQYAWVHVWIILRKNGSVKAIAVFAVNCLVLEFNVVLLLLSPYQKLLFIDVEHIIISFNMIHILNLTVPFHEFLKQGILCLLNFAGMLQSWESPGRNTTLNNNVNLYVG